MREYYIYKIWLVYFSFIVAIILQIISFILKVWSYQIQPSWIMILLVYWTTNFPNQFNIGTSFILGLITDVIFGDILGIHSLSWSILSYLIIKKLYFFKYMLLWKQSIIVMLISAVHQIIKLLIKMIITEILFTEDFFWNCILDGGVWLIFSIFIKKYFNFSTYKNICF